MHKQLKKYLTIFFLFLLLFPNIEKGVHAFEHHNEVHCSITDHHFHELESECAICDYTPSVSNDIPSNDITFVISSQRFSHIAFSEGIIIPHTFSNLPSRAPPFA